MPTPLPADALIALAPHCRVIRTPPAEVYLITDIDELRLTGELFCDLAAHLDGTRMLVDIIGQMVADGTATAEEVPAAVGIMRERGFVVDAREHAAPTGLFTLWWGVDMHEQARGVAVHVASVGTSPASYVEAAIAEHGLRVVPEYSDADYAVIVADDYLNPDLVAAVGQARAAGLPVLLVNLAGARPTVGPWLGEPGPCLECLANRLRFNRQVEQRLLAAGDRMGPVAHGWTPGTAGHAATEAALAVKRRAIGLPDANAHGDPAVAHMLVFDHTTGERSAHHVVRRPQCHECGSPLTVDDDFHVISLQGGALDAKDDGSYRKLTPQQTIDRYGHHVSRRTGVVEQLRRTTDDASVIHVVESGINLATVRKGSKACGFRQSAGGKGTSAEQARAGALAEAIERFAATYTGEEATIVGSKDALGDEAIDPRTLTLFSAAQYADRKHWNATHKGMHKVPMEFDPSIEMEWSPAWSITRNARVWVPTALAYYLYGGALPRNGCAADSNGNAAGTSLEDAILQGFFELVERDAVATWWYNRIPRPAADLDAYAAHFAEKYLHQVQDHYARVLDRDLWVLDITSDLGVPSFAAASQARTGNPRMLLGFGAHRDPRGALLRAITEMNQMLGMIPSLEHPQADGAVGLSPEVAWWRQESLADHPYVFPTGHPVRPQAHAHDWTTDGKDNVERVAALVASRGMELHVLNMTAPDVGMPVVKVMVPGMRHFWPRYAPGRLYDVPVSMGWLTEPLTEAQLNPTPIFW
ncbi:MAG: TOMM precursor leader peptide-binding protein [Actinomycetales bacterium]